MTLNGSGLPVIGRQPPLRDQTGHSCARSPARWMVTTRSKEAGQFSRSDDFIGRPFTIEAESDEPGSALVEAVSPVLRAVWNRGDAVAACDFEDEHPDVGGTTRYR